MEDYFWCAVCRSVVVCEHMNAGGMGANVTKDN